MFRWIVVFAWVAGILGVAGSVLIFYKIRLHNSVEAKVNSKKLTENVDTLNSLQEPSLTANQPAQKSETSAIESLPETSTALESNTTVKNGKGDTDPATKLLSQQGLQHLLSDIRQAEKKYNVASKCIRFRRSAAVNNVALYRQVQAFLTGRHYSLQAIEATNQPVKGITISPDSDCMRVTVGNF